MKALLAIWSDAAIQSQLDGTTRNNEVFKRISDELNARGIPDKTPSQCQNKLKNLKREYKKVKDYNRNQSGGKRKSRPYFETLDRTLGCRPAAWRVAMHCGSEKITTARRRRTRPGLRVRSVNTHGCIRIEHYTVHAAADRRHEHCMNVASL